MNQRDESVRTAETDEHNRMLVSKRASLELVIPDRLAYTILWSWGWAAD